MIKKVTDNINLSGVSSPLLPLIYCDFVYNSGDSDGVYYLYDNNDEPAAVFSVKNCCATFVKIKEADYSELSMFFDFYGVAEVLSDYPFDESFRSIPLLEAESRMVGYTTVERLSESSKMSEYLGVFNLLNDTDGDFARWYSVFSKKINSSVSCGVYKLFENTVVSTATATAIYENTAVISGVFTDPSQRGRGYASECVNAVIDELFKMNVRRIFLWCDADKVPFYEKLGFSSNGEIYIRRV